MRRRPWRPRPSTPRPPVASSPPPRRTWPATCGSPSAAQKLAAKRAIDGLGMGEPSAVLVDGHWDFVGGGRSRRIIRGDAGCLSIATASVIAKVTRDRLMQQEAEHFPAYDFDKNKGYPCPRHKAALAAFGPTSIHRRAWIFMEHMVWGGVRRYSRQPELWDQQ